MELVSKVPNISKKASVPQTEQDDMSRVRLEIIFSEALEEDFQQEFKEVGVGRHFTKFAGVMGAGYNNPHLGDSVWPQLNMMYVIYCDREDAKKIRQIIAKLRKKYLTEGIACFMSKSVEL